MSHGADHSIEQIESSAHAVASSITTLIDHLRNVPEFALVSMKNVIQGYSKPRSNHKPSDSPFYLYKHLQKLGFTEEVYKMISSYNPPFPTKLSRPSANHVELDRQTLVYEILFPLLSSLAYWFNFLDKYPSTKITSAEKNQMGKSIKPTPPVGMLSLSNFTDIACLLEFTCCSTILPNLEPNVLIPTSAEDRCKVMPKTMAGRMPKRCLCWGYCVHEESIALGIATEPQTQNDKILQSKLELMDATIVLTQVILLDRFRPILFKRHISDLFAAIFQVDQYDSLHCDDNEDYLQLSSSNQVLWDQIKRYFIPSPRDASPISSPLLFFNIEQIDYHGRAKAYQSLLLGGKNSPAWLRSRVGSLLTQLALSDHEGLQAIIDVFAVAANSLPTEEITSASNRLGRVLSRANQDDRDYFTMNYYENLFRNLSVILELIGVDRSQKGNIYDDVRARATVQTTWSILENTSVEATQRYFVPSLIGGLLPIFPMKSQATGEQDELEESSKRIRRSLLRLYALLLYLPPGLPREGDIFSVICQILLSPLPLDELIIEESGSACLSDVTLPSILLRIINAGEKSKNIVAIDVGSRIDVHDHNMLDHLAKYVFRSLLTTVLKYCSFSSLGTEEVTNEKVLAVSLVKSVMFNRLDLAGWAFYSSTSDESSQSIISFVYRETNENILQDQTESLAKELFCILSTEIQTEHDDLSSTEHDPNSFPNYLSLQWVLLQLLLILYFTYSSSIHRIVVPYSLVAVPSKFSNVAILNLLSIFCEKCSLETIITHDATNNSAIHLLHLIISTVSTHFVNSNTGCCTEISNFIIENKNIDYSRCDVPFGVNNKKNLLIALNNGSNDDMIYIDPNEESVSGIRDGNTPRKDLSVEDKESMTSLLSIVLTLLVAILERDSYSVNKEMLQSMVPFLTMISSPDFIDSPSSSDTFAIAHLAEIATHAMTLIVSRENRGNDIICEKKNENVYVSIHEILRHKIRDASKDLSSTEAPIRAKGLVTLRHLARSSLLEELHLETSLDPKQKLSTIRRGDYQLVEEITEHTKDPDKSAIRLLGDIFELSLISLDDSESYVFLAGIQTVVVLADVMPYYIIPILTDAICTGVASFLNSNELLSEKLSSSQRVKLTEATLFIIRRRGSAINDYGKKVLERMIHGKAIAPTSHATEVHQSLERSAMVQSATYSYFHDTSLATDETIQSMSEEVNIRVATGGPLFDVEESDLLRSSCIHVVSELVLALSPSIIVQYCPSLCRLSLNALRLDDSRVIRRATAMLCKCLYICASKEMELIIQDTIPEFTVSLVRCDEELLFAVLNRCISGDDVDLLNQKSCTSSSILNVVQGKVRLFDEATVARCKEAVALREELQKEGFLDIARALAKSRADDMDNPLVRFLV